MRLIDRILPSHRWPTDETVMLMRAVSGLSSKERTSVLLNAERIICEEVGVNIPHHQYPLFLNADRLRRAFLRANIEVPL